jgi:transcriptional regulator with XRE-family HTH domain
MGNVRRKQIPNWLRKHRKRWGYRQKEVAEMLGFKSANRLSRWEKGISVPSVPNLLKLGIIYATLTDQLYHELLIQLRPALNKRKEEVLRKRKAQYNTKTK